MSNKIYIEQYKILIQIDNINQYEIIKDKLSNINSNDFFSNNNIHEKLFSKKYLIKKDFLSSYQIFFLESDHTIQIIKRNHSEILYENFEEFINKFNNRFNIFSKDEIRKYLYESSLILNSNEIFFMTSSQKKFLIYIKDDNIILYPIIKNILNKDESLKSYYKKIFDSIMKSIDGFIKNRVKILENQIIINYYDAIDQFFYIIKKIIISDEIFEQDFDTKKYINDLLNFIIKDIVFSELQSLKIGIECDEMHPLYKYKKITLITYRLFNKILNLNGDLCELSQLDITQLSDAFLYENIFENAPSFILKSYKRLSKAIPFKILEKIIKKQKITEYSI
jgi:hypothetical protein